MKYIVLIFLFFNFSNAQLVYEDFEDIGLPTGWTTGTGSPDYDYTPAIYGRRSANLPSGVTCNFRKDLSLSYDSLEIVFAIKFSDATPSSALQFFAIGSPSTMGSLYLWTGGNLRIYHGSGNNISSGTLSDNTLYYIWVFFKKGTGADGIARAYVSTTPTKPETAWCNVTNGTSTGTYNRTIFQGVSAAASSIVIDEITIQSSPRLGNFNVPSYPDKHSYFNKFNGCNGYYGW